MNANENQIVVYQPNETVRLDVRLENETVWLTQSQMGELFGCTTRNVSMHLDNIYSCGELVPEGTRKDFFLVRLEGSRQVRRTVTCYNLDAIISVGYRVNSILVGSRVPRDRKADSCGRAGRATLPPIPDDERLWRNPANQEVGVWGGESEGQDMIDGTINDGKTGAAARTWCLPGAITSSGSGVRHDDRANGGRSGKSGTICMVEEDSLTARLSAVGASAQFPHAALAAKSMTFRRKINERRR